MPLLDFLTLYVLAALWLLLALPRKPANRILEVLFPIIRHYYFRKERETGPRLYASEQ